MNSPQAFDAIIIGAGQAGPALAARLTQTGMKIAVIERHWFGGTCVNTGCMPTKTLVASAAVARHVQRAREFGIMVDGASIDMRAIKARKDAVVMNSRSSVEKWLRGMPNCAVIQGHARFIGDHDIRVDDGPTLTAPRIFLNVGGRARIPALPGIGDIRYHTNTSIMELDAAPRHLAIIGGSYVGLEFAQIFRRFGSEVTVVERNGHLVSHEDDDVCEGVREILESEGIHVRTNAECVRFHAADDGILVGVQCHAGEPEISASHVLLAMGRRPNTDDLGIEHTGIDLDDHGYVEVDDHLSTSVSGVWALGDCNGRGAFTHTAYNDYEIVAANVLDGQARRVSDRIACYALFIDPPLGRVGLTETAARAQGLKLRIGKRPMARVGRAVERSETQGFMKVIVDADSERIVGASVLGVGGDEAVHCLLDTMAANQPYGTLQRTMHIHPTVAELIPTVLGELAPGPAPA